MMGRWQRETRSCAPPGGSRRRRRVRRSRPAPRTRAGAPPASSASTAVTLERVDTHGKHLLLGFGDLVLHSHLGMSGGWHVYPPGARWRRPRRSAWAVLAGERRDGGPVRRPDPAGAAGGARCAATRSSPRLGPDILAPEFDLDAGRRGDPRRPGPRPRRRPARPDAWSPGSATSSRARPASPPGSTPGARSATSATRSSRAVLGAAREQMLARGRERRATPSPSTVARRPCPRCRGPISSRGQGDANRTTYWCPRCQD